MNETYKTIESLCVSSGITVNKMCTEIGISNSVLSDFKKGRTHKLSTKTLEKISLYFNVPIDDLLYPGTTIESDIPPEPEISDSQLLFALYGEVPDEITDEDILDIKKYAAFVRQRKIKNKED